MNKIRMIKTVILLGIVMSLLGCQWKESPQQSQLSETKTSVVFKDDLGYEVSVNQPQRVAVISGSYAQIWLLAGGDLMATTQDAKEEQGLVLAEDVVDLGSVKTPNLEKLIESQADLVILSATIQKHVELRSGLEQMGIQTAYFEVEDFKDYLRMLKICTEITGHPECYEICGTQIQEAIDKQIARGDGSQKTVLFMRAFSSGVKAKGSDSMTGKMLKDLGCVNIADTETTLTEDLSMEYILQEDPEYIFVTTMGEDSDKALKVVEEVLISNPAWQQLSAVKEGHYVVLPKELFHNKPNDRWAESYHQLADILYGAE